MEKTSKLITGAQQAKRVFPVAVSVILSIVFILVGQIVIVFPVGMLTEIFYSLFTVLSQQSIPAESLQMDAMMLGRLFGFIGITIAIGLWVKFIEKRPFSTIGFFKGQIVKKLLVGWGWGLLLFGIVLFFLWLFGMLTIEEITITPYSLLMFGIFVIGWQIQGGTEEVLTRGWLLPIVGVRSNIRIGMIVSSVLFGVLHLTNNAVSIIPIVNICLYGLAMSIYALKEDDIWGVCGLHAAWNCVQGSIVGLPVSGNHIPSSLMRMSTSGPIWLSGGEFGPEGSVFTSAMLLLFIVYLLVMKDLKRKNGKYQV